MKKIRTFIAHPIPEQWKQLIGNAYDELKEGLNSRIAWVKPDNMHFTLKFLGDIPEENISSLSRALQNIPISPFEISMGNPGFFPGPESPRIIWIDLDQGANELCANAQSVDSQLSSLGFDKNPKPCHAHLTLGRIKKLANDDWMDLSSRISKIKLPPAKITGFTLYRSYLKPEGPVYAELQKFGD